MTDLTKPEKLLLAATRLSTEGVDAFTAEDLVVAAFRAFPTDFCLKGYAQYPDNNCVYKSLMGKDARLIVSGWLEKTGTKKYRITAKGAHDAAQLQSPQVDADSTASTPNRGIEEALGRLLDSTAFDTFRAGHAERITFHQFCRFVGLSAPDSWQRIQGKLQTTQHLVQEARRMGEAGVTLRPYFRRATHSYSPEDLMLLKTLFDDLSVKFRGEMQAWEQKVHPSK